MWSRSSPNIINTSHKHLVRPPCAAGCSSHERSSDVWCMWRRLCRLNEDVRLPITQCRLSTANDACPLKLHRANVALCYISWIPSQPWCAHWICPRPVVCVNCTLYTPTSQRAVLCEYCATVDNTTIVLITNTRPCWD